MKTTFGLLMLAAVLLSPLVGSADELRPASIRSAVAPTVNVAPKPRRAPWHVSVGAAELRLDLAATRVGITLCFAL